MKKFFALFVAFLFTTVSVFADKVLTKADMNGSWIVGTWDLEFYSFIYGEGENTLSGVIEIKGGRDNSKVIMTSDGEVEETTFGEFKNDFFEMFEATNDPEFRQSFYEAKEQGIAATGEPDVYLNDAKDTIYFDIGLGDILILNCSFKKR